MDFAELMAILTNPGDEGIPDTIYDDLSTSHSDAVGGRDAKIVEMDNQIQALTGEVSRLKSQNYDLLMSVPGEGSGETESDEGESDDSPEGVDSLFEDKE